MDKLLSDIAIEFRNKYKDDLQLGKISRKFDFEETFLKIHKNLENASHVEAKAPKYELSYIISAILFS